MRLRRSETRLDRTRPHLSMRGSLTHQMKGKQGQAAIGKIEEKFLALLLNLTQCENWDKVSLPGLAVASRTNVASPQGLQNEINSMRDCRSNHFFVRFYMHLPIKSKF